MTSDKIIYVTHFQREGMSDPVVGTGSVKSESVMKHLVTQHASLAARAHFAASPPCLRVDTRVHMYCSGSCDVSF